MPNFLMYPLGLPHRWHRLYFRTLNFGFLFAFTISAFLATDTPFHRWSYVLNGIPKPLSSSKASSSVFALVTMVTFSPRIRSIWS